MIIWSEGYHSIRYGQWGDVDCSLLGTKSVGSILYMYLALLSIVRDSATFTELHCVATGGRHPRVVVMFQHHGGRSHYSGGNRGISRAPWLWLGSCSLHRSLWQGFSYHTQPSLPLFNSFLSWCADSSSPAATFVSSPYFETKGPNPKPKKEKLTVFKMP